MSGAPRRGRHERMFDDGLLVKGLEGCCHLDSCSLSWVHVHAGIMRKSRRRRIGAPGCRRVDNLPRPDDHWSLDSEARSSGGPCFASGSGGACFAGRARSGRAGRVRHTRGADARSAAHTLSGRASESAGRSDGGGRAPGGNAADTHPSHPAGRGTREPSRGRARGGVFVGVRPFVLTRRAPAACPESRRCHCNHKYPLPLTAHDHGGVLARSRGGGKWGAHVTPRSKSLWISSGVAP